MLSSLIFAIMLIPNSSNRVTLATIAPVVQASRRGQEFNIDQAPSISALNAPSLFAGSTQAPSNGSQVLRIKITRPDGIVDIRTTPPDKGGKFSFAYEPKMYGEFTVTFEGYGGDVLQQIRFSVSPWNNIAQHVTQRARRIQTHIRRIRTAVQTEISQRPPGEKQTDLQRKLERIATEQEKFLEYLAHMETATEQLIAAGTEEPRLAPKVGEVLNQLSQWSTDAADEEARLQQIADQMRTGPSTCDTLETAAEGMQFVSNAMIFVTTPVKIFTNLLLEKVLPAADNLSNANDAAKLAVSEVRKEGVAALEGSAGVIGSLVGLTGDIASFITNRYFGDYCKVIEGELKAEFSVDSKQGGKSYWKYKINMTAKVRLWTDKNAPVQPLGSPYSGRIEGNVTRLEFFEDIFVIEKPPAGGTVVLRKKIMPPVLSSNIANEQTGMGQIGHRVVPGYFNVRYLAWLNENRMSFKQDSVGSDFSDSYMNKLALVIIPQGGLVPIFRIFDFPMQKAAWIVDRTTKGPFEIPVTTVSNKSVIKKEFTRNETVDNGNIAVAFKTMWDIKEK